MDVVVEDVVDSSDSESENDFGSVDSTDCESENNLPNNTNSSAKQPQDEMNAKHIPDLLLLSGKINDFLVFVDRPEIAKLEKTDNTRYYQALISKFDDMPMSIIKLLMDSSTRIKNLERLSDMLDTLQEIKDNKRDIHSTYEEYKERLNNEFIYSKYGGKEEFEKALKKKGKKKVYKKPPKKS